MRWLVAVALVSSLCLVSLVGQAVPAAAAASGPTGTSLAPSTGAGLAPLLAHASTTLGHARGHAPATTPIGRIVGGQEAKPGAYPYMVLVAASEPDNTTAQCAGTIVDRYWVLTAAHCIAAATAVTVSFGSQDVQQQWLLFEILPSDVVVHPGFNASTLANDLALLPVDLPGGFLPVPVLPASLASQVSPGTMTTVLGWGVLREPSAFPPPPTAATRDFPIPDAPERLLHQTTVPVVDHDACNAAYEGAVTADMLCAGSRGHDACQGDSGGPLLVRVAGTTYEAGVVSWGHGCGRAGLAGVYAAVAPQQAWLESVVGHDLGPLGRLQVTVNAPWSDGGAHVDVFPAANDGPRAHARALASCDLQPLQSSATCTAAAGVHIEGSAPATGGAPELLLPPGKYVVRLSALAMSGQTVSDATSRTVSVKAGMLAKTSWMPQPNVRLLRMGSASPFPAYVANFTDGHGAYAGICFVVPVALAVDCDDGATALHYPYVAAPAAAQVTLQGYGISFGEDDVYPVPVTGFTTAGIPRSGLVVPHLVPSGAVILLQPSGHVGDGVVVAFNATDMSGLGGCFVEVAWHWIACGDQAAALEYPYVTLPATADQTLVIQVFSPTVANVAQTISAPTGAVTTFAFQAH